MITNPSIKSQSNEILSKNVNSTIEILDEITQNFVIHLPLVLTLFGLIGFIGNSFTYLQRTLRYNTCCIYSLCGSFVDITNLFINLLPLYIDKSVGNLSLRISISLLCKLKLFVLVFLPQLSMNFLILSLIDRYACTCSTTSTLRHLRRLKLAPWLILITIILSCFMSIYTPILYDVISNVGCTSTQPNLSSILYILINGTLTPLLMLAFVALTYHNIRQSHRRVNLVINGRRNHFRNQFIRTIFAQVFGTAFFSLPWICTYLYYLTIGYTIHNQEQLVILYFLLSLTNNLYYIINVKSFYLSLLTSRRFRVTLKKACRRTFTYTLNRI